MKKIVGIMLLGLLASGTAQAEPVPTYVLDKEFTNCMGGEDPQQSADRAAYCTCIRNKMAGWDVDTYGAAATEQMQSGGKPTASLSDMAKECVAQVLK